MYRSSSRSVRLPALSRSFPIAVHLLLLTLLAGALAVLPASPARAAAPYQHSTCVPGTSWYAVVSFLYLGHCHLPVEWQRAGDLKTDYREVTLPNGVRVRGREFDGCSDPGVDKPLGFDFRHACWMHDFGYELIRRGVLPRQAEHNVDRVFGAALLSICRDTYRGNRLCVGVATDYRTAVLKFDSFVGRFEDSPPDWRTVLPVGARGLLQSVNYPTHFVAPAATGSRLASASAAVAAGGKLRVVKGLAGSGVSFESVKYPGRFLRHQNYVWKLQPKQNSALFRADATFRAEHGRNGRPDLTSLKSYNFGDRYVRHYRGRVEVSSSTFRRGTPFVHDASFVWVQAR